VRLSPHPALQQVLLRVSRPRKTSSTVSAFCRVASVHCCTEAP